MTHRKHIIVVGAGAGGLSAAIDLARSGHDITVLERNSEAGGKIRQRLVKNNRGIDVGPTVFTMRWIFDSLFEDAGASFADALTLHPASILARHAWASNDKPNGKLDLYADIDRSAEAIAAFASPRDAEGYRQFCAQSQKVFDVLRDSFITDQRPSQLDVVKRVGVDRLAGWLATIRPWRTLWQELGTYFDDPRLRQLFARYATYVGSSPLATPATIMLVAHVEQQGVWHVDGGMRAVAQAMQSLGEGLGVTFRFDAPVARVRLTGRRASAVELETGEVIEADGIIFNGDISAIGGGLLGDELRSRAPVTPRKKRSLSAVTWSVHAPTSGFDLAFHTVFFADRYPNEFRSIFSDRTIAQMPTVYVCAQDRGENEAVPIQPGEDERLFLLVNAPADGDIKCHTPEQLEDLKMRVLKLLRVCGLHIDDFDATASLTEPADFSARFPATGGALYGQSSHGMMSTLNRNGARSQIPGLYFAGGSVHPGPGVPMATMSGRLAAQQYLADQRSGRA
ncbi:MAG: 1-hydroxycarotenoid 3,4-desaturase CrtD [Pseudomonadota bacterium]